MKDRGVQMIITYGIKLSFLLSNSLADHLGSLLENEKLEMGPNLSFLHTERCESETAIIVFFPEKSRVIIWEYVLRPQLNHVFNLGFVYK